MLLLLASNLGMGGGIGLAEETGIGLAPVATPVDFVLESPHWMPRTVRPFGQVRPSRSPETQDKAELREMMQLYEKWRRSA